MAFLNNMSEKRKSTSPTAIQVKNLGETIGTEEELEAISLLKIGRMKCCYVNCNVRLAHSSILKICDNAGRIKDRAQSEKKVFV
jgi:hypothetical protein